MNEWKYKDCLSCPFREEGASKVIGPSYISQCTAACPPKEICWFTPSGGERPDWCPPQDAAQQSGEEEIAKAQNVAAHAELDRLQTEQPV